MGWLVFYNGNSRDKEVDISFRISQRLDALIEYTPLIYNDEVVGVKIDNVVCFLYYREYLYR